MSNFKFSFFIVLVFTFCNVSSQTLIMNEVSNGISGSGGGTQEYVEFVVASNTTTYSCSSSTPPCIDIRGWIFDDNSGYHGPSGVATGAVRFSQNVLWSCLPLGTIIVIYNGADKNPAIPTPDDVSLTDGNCRIIADIGNTILFEKNSTTPGAAACSYPATGWIAGGTWGNTALANTSDCARIVNLAGCEVFSVCYGAADNLNNLIYFSGTGTGNVYFFNGVDPQLQTNWSSGNSSTMQTPGVPNNAANAAYINQFNNGCAPITTLSVTAVSVNAGCTCNGSATASASGSIAGYTYIWYDAAMNPIGQTAATATGLCAGVYEVVATSHIGCTAMASVTITSSSSTSVSVNSQTVCAGTPAILTATPSATGGTFSWSPGGQTTSSISVIPSSTTTYSVIYTLAGCSGNNNGIVTVNSLPTITVNSPTICSGQTATLTANGAGTYTWNTGSSTNPLSVAPSSNTNYTVTGTMTGCTNTAVVSVVVNSSPTITVNSSTICSGQTATLTANGAGTYTWSAGSSINPLSVSPTSNTNYTVTGIMAGCTNTAVSNVVVNSSPAITVNSPTICSGQTVTLTANGASTYIWNTGSSANFLPVSPSSNTSYTVTGTTAGCTNTAVSTVIVNSNPTVTVNSATVCSGQSVTLTANGASTYTWNTGSSANFLPVSPSSNTSYTVTGTTAGCTNTAVSTIIVNSNPTVTVNSATVCSGQTVTLTANGASTYTWNTGSSANPLSASPGSNASYTVTGTTAGCTNSAVSNVVVNSTPTVTVISPTICAGQSATLTASGATSYSWNTGSTSNQILVSPTSSSNFTVLGISTGCTNTAVVSVNVIPVPTITVNSLTICSGQTATLTANGAGTYIWNTGSSSNPLFVSPSTNTDFTVTGTANGCTNTAVSNVIVNPTPILSVTSATTCTGQTATLTASGANTYTWNTGSNSVSITDNPAVTTTYSITGNLSGCSNTNTASITVSSNLSLSINTPTTCAGEITTLIAVGANTYTWSNGSSGNTITVAPASTTAFSVTGSNGACTGSVATNVIVNPLPQVTVNSPTLCSGQTATLIANGASTYIWNTGSSVNPLSISPGSTINYTVTGTANGCTNTAISNVIVNPLPVITVNSPTICSGQVATLTANGASSYIWSTGSSTNQLIVSPVSNTNYTLTGTTNNCTNTITANVFVVSAPTVIVNSVSICSGQTATLIANGASNYLWSNGSVSNPLIVNNLTGSTIYTVTGFNGACSATASSSITVNNSPNIIFSPNLSSGCSPLCVSFLNLTTVSGGTISSWNWSFGNGSTASNQNPNYCFTDPGSYNISLTASSSNGCSKTATINNMINVFPNPTAEFTSNFQETDIFNPVIEFTNQSLNASSYHWNFGDTASSSQINPTYTYDQEGIYSTTLTATNQYGCENIIIHDIIVKSIFTFYAPNTFTPNEDNINDVFLPLGIGWDKDKYQFDIFDRWGENCFTTKEINKGWDGRANKGSEVVQIGAYTWKVELSDVFGAKHKYIGKVMILK